MNALAHSLLREDPRQAASLASEVLTAISREKDGPHGKLPACAQALCTLGCAHLQWSQYKSAREYLAKSLEFSQKSRVLSDSARAHVHLAEVCLLTGEWVDGLQHGQQAHRLASDLGRTDLEAASLCVIAQAHLAFEQIDDAIQALLEGINLDRKLPPAERLPDLYAHLCSAYIDLGEIEKASRAAEEGLDICRRIRYPHARAKIETLLARLYLDQQDSPRADALLQPLLETTADLGFRHEHASSMVVLAELHLRREQPEKARLLLEEALAEAEALGAMTLTAGILERLVAACRSQGDLAAALDYQEQRQKRLGKMPLPSRLADLFKPSLEAELAAAREEARAARLHSLALEKETAVLRKKQAEWKELAIRHPLTGIFNRRHFFSLGEQQVQLALRYQRPLSAMMIDIDDFKSVNDRFGHQMGDEVLIGVASRLQESLRLSDILGQYGGDEFAILLPETSLGQAQDAAQRIRNAFQRFSVHAGPHQVSVNLSIGISRLESQDRNLAGLLARADMALNTSKRNGKDRISVHEEETDAASLCAGPVKDGVPSTWQEDHLLADASPVFL